MKTIYLLLLVALAALAESRIKQSRRDKREILVRSKRRWVLSTIELEEENPGPYRLKISQMFNNMSGDHHEFKISGMGVDEPPLGVFEIDSHTGDVFATRPLDREIYRNPFHIKFDILHQNTKEKLDKELAFDVELKDINDNPPIFDPPHMTESVMEGSRERDLPPLLFVSDIDKEDTVNSQISVNVVSQNPNEPKLGIRKINEHQYRLILVDGCFDYDKVKKYEVVVKAFDHGKPVQSSTSTVTLNVLDTNTHPPKFKKKQYSGDVKEATIKKDILRVAVDDNDTPNTPGWRAVYFFIKGNEDDNYQIETDPQTNEGVLSVIKKKDYEKTMKAKLHIGVRNEEPLTICKDFKDGGEVNEEITDTAVIEIKVIDINDPPIFDKNPVDVYQREEEPPGKTLHIPAVHDAENNMVRFELVQDPASWVTVDEKTGKVTSISKMDRESPYVDDSNIYTVIIRAIDDGVPPASSSCTVRIHLGDVNDNMPQLVSKRVLMCGNKVDRVMVQANDSDVDPYAGPFTFTLGGDDPSLSERWKFDPSTGVAGGLVSLKTLPYGTYSVPLMIHDQQNMVGEDTVEVTVCDCGKSDVCKEKEPATSSLGPAGIGLIFAGLLLFLLLLLIFMCQCGKKEFAIPIAEDEGNQTLIKYNQEGGGSECKSVPSLPLTPTHTETVTDGIKMGTKQLSQAAPGMREEMEAYNTYSQTMMNSHMSVMNSERQRDSFRSQGGQNMYSGWNTYRNNSFQGGSSGYHYTRSQRSNQHIADHIDRRLPLIDGNQVNYPAYNPHEYTYEGQGSRSQSLDKLSLSNYGDDMNFLNDLGPKFKTLGGIMQQKIQEKNLKP